MTYVIVIYETYQLCICLQNIDQSSHNGNHLFHPHIFHGLYKDSLYTHPCLK